MSDTEQDSSWYEGAEEFASGAFDAVGHVAEAGIEGTVHAFEAAGATAEEAASLIAPEARVVPGLSEVLAVGETAYHGGAGIYDLATGDSDAAAGQFGHMSEAAVSAATFGITGMAEGAYDIYNSATGGDENSSAHGILMGGLESAGDAIGDFAYDTLNPGE